MSTAFVPVDGAVTNIPIFHHTDGGAAGSAGAANRSTESFIMWRITWRIPLLPPYWTVP